MKPSALPGQISVFDQLEPHQVRIGGCGSCVCEICMRRWQSKCPFGGCWDDRRAEIMPYDVTHGGKIRDLWSDWAKPGEQAHWCRGGCFYPAYVCEHFVPYERPLIRECLNAPVTIWKDGTLDCALVGVIGCEECMRQWEERNTYGEI